MELTLASLVNEALSDCGCGLRQLQKLPLRMRLRRKELPVSVEGNERFTNEPAERVEARAGTRLASSRCVVVQRDEDVMKKMLKQFIADESGATAIEYGLIAAGIAIAIVPALNGVGSGLKGQIHDHQHLAEVIARRMSEIRGTTARLPCRAGVVTACGAWMCAIAS